MGPHSRIILNTLLLETELELGESSRFNISSNLLLPALVFLLFFTFFCEWYITPKIAADQSVAQHKKSIYNIKQTSREASSWKKNRKERRA